MLEVDSQLPQPGAGSGLVVFHRGRHHPKRVRVSRSQEVEKTRDFPASSEFLPPLKWPPPVNSQLTLLLAGFQKESPRLARLPSRSDAVITSRQRGAQRSAREKHTMNAWSGSFLLIATMALGICGGCRKSEDTASKAAPPQPAAELPVASAVAITPPAAAAPPSPPPYGEAARAAGIAGTLETTPSPVVVCEKTGIGVATVAWTVSGTTSVEIRVGTPDGTLFIKAGGPGSGKTGHWVTKDSVFFLQDTTNDAPRTLAHTLAKLAVEVANGPCP
jgi:hypothetical protein